MRRLAGYLLVVLLVALMASPAPAQSRGFFGGLFGGEREVAPPPGAIPNAPGAGRAPPQQRPAQPQRRKAAPARPAQPAEPSFPVAEIAPKSDDAKKVLVIGDFVASGLAWGLDQAFADDPTHRVLDRSDGSSGLVRDDHYDWTASLPDLVSEVAPDVIVVMIGINDRQPIRAAAGNLALRSDAWDAAYAERVDRFVAALKAAGRPVIWVGEPPLRSADGSADMAFLNTLFKEKAEAAGMRFVDVWDGFAGEDGKFVLRGPDMDGQVRQLRSGDGINFTKSGRRKLAFYVERDLGNGTAGPGAAQPLNPSATVEIGADGKPRLVGPVMSLTDPAPPAPGTPLAGAAAPMPPLAGASPTPLAGPAPAAPLPDPVAALTSGAALPPAPAGRADDFTWRPPAPAITGATSAVDGIVILPAAAPTR